MTHVKSGALTVLLAITAGCAGVKTAPPLVLNQPLMLSANSMELIELDFTPAEKAVISHPGIAEVLPGAHEKQLRIRARIEGYTAVDILREDGTLGRRYGLQVISAKQELVLTQVYELLKGVEGISIYPKGPLVVVDGALVKPDTVVRDFDRVLSVTEVYKDFVFNLVTISPQLYDASAKIMTEEIQALPGSKDISVRVVNGTFFLFGNAQTQAERERAEVIVQTYLPPMLGSQAIRDNVLIIGAKKFSIRNMVQIGASPDRAPASSK